MKFLFLKHWIPSENLLETSLGEEIPKQLIEDGKNGGRANIIGLKQALKCFKLEQLWQL